MQFIAVMRLRKSSALLLLGAALYGCSRPATTNTEAPGPAREMRGFIDRMRDYIVLRDRFVNTLPGIFSGAEPARIVEHRRLLSEAIRRERASAKPGDVFGDARDPILEIVRSELKLASARRAVMKENDERESKVAVRVNGEYPADAPLSMVPPALLARLPEPPRPLEYRFVGRDLILFDSSARLMVDVIEGAVP